MRKEAGRAAHPEEPMMSCSAVTFMTLMVDVLNAEKRDREGTTKPGATVT